MRSVIRQRVFGRLKARARQSSLARGIALPVQRLIRVEQTAAMPLLVATAIALLWANSPWRASYEALWSTRWSFDFGLLAHDDTVVHWVDITLMPLFFFVIGLEIKRELIHGNLRDPRIAALPAATALGGIVMPALIFLALTAGEPTSSAWGVVVATDIAFALAAVRLLGDRVPEALTMLILTFAVIDDIIGVLIIALFYSDAISYGALGVLTALLGLVVLCRVAGIWSLAVYALLGLACWLVMIQSGIHPTILGVVLGLMTPTQPLFERAEATRLITRVSERLSVIESKRENARDDTERFVELEEKEETVFGYLETAVVGSEAPAERLLRWLNPWVGFFVLPVFALANTGIDLSFSSLRAAAMDSPAAAGTVAGLVLGKPLGIVVLGFLALRLKLAELPEGLTMRHVIAIGVLGGVGFTISLFIADLGLEGSGQLQSVKLAILVSSVLAGTAGWALLRFWSALGLKTQLKLGRPA